MLRYLRPNKWKPAPIVGPARAFGPVVIAAFSTLAAGYFLDSNYQFSNRIELRAEAAKAVASKAARLRERLNKDIEPISLVEKKLIETSSIDQEHFQALAKSIFAQNDDIVQIEATLEAGTILTASRDGVPLIRPPQKRLAGAGSAAYSADASSELRFSSIFLGGPSRWVFSAEMPIFTTAEGHTRPWGNVSVVIDADKFFAETGLSYSGTGKFHYVVRPHQAGSSALMPFFRTDQIRTVFSSDPVITTVQVMDSRWHIAAIPEGGWDTPPANLTLIRIAILLAGLALILPLFFSAKLRLERHQTIAKLRKREIELENMTRRLDMALDSYRCGVWEAEVNVAETFWDERMHELHGIPGEAGWASRKNWLTLVHPDDRNEARDALVKAIELSQPFAHQCRIVLPDGTIRHIRYVARLHETPEGGSRLFGIAVDVTEDFVLTDALRRAKTESEDKNAKLQSALTALRRREAELTETSQRLKLATDAYECGVWESDLEAGTHYWDERMHELFGIAFIDGNTNPQVWLDHIHPDDRDKTLLARTHAIETGERFFATYRIFPLNGGMRYVQAVGQVYTTPGGVRKFIGISIDVTGDMLKNEALIAAKNDAEARQAELEAAHLRIQYNAMHDPLTGLANRRALDEALDRLAAENRDPHERVTLLHIDLDRFKQINDTLGHAAGDAMLVHAADILSRNTRKCDLVARVGGDEFVVLMQNNASNKEVAGLAKRMVESMNQPVIYEGHECRFGVSIGIAREQAKRNSVRKLMVNADIALYRAKAHGRNRVEFFTSNLHSEIRRTKKLADEILRGIENDEFRPWYQPQFDSTNHQLSGVEALVRWHHPERGVLGPDVFLKTAEEINVLSILDRIVLENALTDRLNWVSKGLIVPKISVNVSARRLRDDELIKSLKELSISGGQIAFELVESIFLDEDDDLIIRNIRRLKSLGIDIEIDDFGTGHTSIVSLLKLEPKRLKIDRQLVSPMLDSPREFSIVQSVIDIGKSLDVETVAEGVETMRHAAKLRELGCTALQGYAFSKPLEAEALLAFVGMEKWKIAV